MKESFRIPNYCHLTGKMKQKPGSLLTATNQKRLFGLFPSFRFTFYQNFHFGVHEFSWLRSPFSKRRAEHSRPFFPGPLHWPSQQALIGRSEKQMTCLVWSPLVQGSISEPWCPCPVGMAATGFGVSHRRHTFGPTVVRSV